MPHYKTIQKCPVISRWAAKTSFIPSKTNPKVEPKWRLQNARTNFYKLAKIILQNPQKRKFGQKYWETKTISWRTFMKRKLKATKTSDKLITSLMLWPIPLISILIMPILWLLIVKRVRITMETPPRRADSTWSNIRRESKCQAWKSTATRLSLPLPGKCHKIIYKCSKPTKTWTSTQSPTGATESKVASRSAHSNLIWLIKASTKKALKILRRCRSSWVWEKKQHKWLLRISVSLGKMAKRWRIRFHTKIQSRTKKVSKGP